MTQNNLGAALRNIGDREEGNDRAAGRRYRRCRQALRVRTRERAPLDWAMTQNNLGNALASLGERSRDPVLLGAAGRRLSPR